MNKCMESNLKLQEKILALEKKLKDSKKNNKELKLKHQNMINQLAHDLKTPLTPIITFLQVLEMDLKSEKLREQAEIAFKNAKYLNDLLHDILMISKKNFKMDLMLESTDIVEVMKDIIESQRMILNKKRIKIVTKIERIPKLNVDRTRFREAIENILKNAYNYSPMSKNIYIDVFRDGKHAKISIRDEGKGIKKENLNKIFDEFFREDYSRTAPHLGLGLSISKKIIEKHKGKITVKSEGEDKGSLFTITLPLDIS